MAAKIMASLFAICGFGVCYAVQAADLVAGRITYIENGWYGEGVAIHSSTNGPSGCSASLNDFAIDKNHASYRELVAIALSAYNSNADVDVIVDTGACTFGGRTKVLSIRLRK